MLSVMFVDLVGSTALSERLDPEELREVVGAYQAASLRAIEQYGGHVAQYLGDGLLVYFGYPTAHEDDAWRAVMAARAIVAEVPQLPARAWGVGDITLAVRIGIHTGLTVVGEVGSGANRERLAMGETPNIAARLQGIAGADEIVISGATQKLVERQFALEPLGAQRVRGLSRTLEVYRVLDTADLRATPVAYGVNPLVGRRAELETILARFARAAGGEGAAVLLEGDAGMGKSRLLQAVREGVQQRTHVWLACGCSSFYQNTFLSPIRALLENIVGVEAIAAPEQRLARLALAMRRIGCPVEETVAPLTPLLVAPNARAEESPELSAQVRKERTLAAVARVLRTIAERHPLVLAVEDVHWADASTLELLELLVQGVGRDRMLIVLTSRTALPAPWLADERVTRLHLAPLAQGDVRELLRVVTEGRGMPEALVEGIVARADGVPIFAEELAKHVLESDVWQERDGALELRAPAESVAIPMTLQGSLLARLDPLGRGKELAQVASVLGRRFDEPLLASVAPMGPESFATALERLELSGVLRRVGRGGQGGRGMLEFRHALLQEAAYDSLLKAARRRLHKEVAETLERDHSEVVDSAPELLGHHWSRAGAPASAIPYLSRAGTRAAAAWANSEALTFCRQALDEIAALGEGDAASAAHWRETERDLHTRIGDLLALLDRREESEAAYRAAIALVPAGDGLTLARLHRAIGMVRQQDAERGWQGLAQAEEALGPAREDWPLAWRREWLAIQLGKLWMHYWFARPDAMAELVARIHPYIEAAASDLQRATYFDLLSLTGCSRERFAISAETLAHAQAYDLAAQATGVLSEIASARFMVGFAHMLHGQVDASVPLLEDALALARRSGHRTIEIRCLTYLVTAHRLAGRADQVMAHLEAAVAGALALQRPEYAGMVEGHRAWLAIRDGDMAAAEAAALSALAMWQASAIAYPFQWSALLPLVAARVARGDAAAAADGARAMLLPHQQRLPAPLESALVALEEARQGGRSPTVSSAAQHVVEMAVANGYLHRAHPASRGDRAGGTLDRT